MAKCSGLPVPTVCRLLEKPLLRPAAYGGESGAAVLDHGAGNACFDGIEEDLLDAGAASIL